MFSSFINWYHLLSLTQAFIIYTLFVFIQKSPQILHASWMSLGIMVTRLA